MRGMKMKKSNILNIGVAVVGAITAILVKTAMKPCMSMVTTESGNQMPMRCHYAGVALFYLAILALVIGVECVVEGKKSTLTCIALMAVTFAVFSGNIGIGVCMGEGMMCGHTKLLGMIAAVVWGVLGVAQFLIKGEKDL